MKKFLTAIAMAGFLACPCVVYAAYIIHLKDGRDFITEQYSEEGDQIKFERYGGLIGIRKDLIREIEEIEKRPPRKKKVVAAEKPPSIEAETGNKENPGEGAAKTETPKAGGGDREKKAKGREQKIPATVSEEEKKKAEQEKAIEIEMLLEEKRQIMGQMEIIAAGLKDAQEKNNKTDKRQWLIERTKLLKTLFELENSVRSAHDGELPDWWRNDL